MTHAEARAPRALAALALAALAAVALLRHAERSRGPRLPPSPVEVNVAGAAELSILPGVGPSLAQAILDDRRAHGPFARPEDLDRVRGIGPSTLARLRAHVAAGPASRAASAYAAR
jgi:competence ComEA-like helix-hairpin-helix protein